MPTNHARLLVILPARTRNITADHALDFKRLGLSHQHGAAFDFVTKILDHLIRERHLVDISGDNMLRDHIPKIVLPKESDLVKNFPLQGNGGRHHHIKRAQPVGRDDQKLVASHAVNVTHLPDRNSWQGQMGLQNSVPFKIPHHHVSVKLRWKKQNSSLASF
ncbi:MAG: hypothetical protein BWY44_00314 [Candidatus Omnitrophica bacterium ADurb.Bin292]|nr:MAG: hypothetical protein BWY44_00314 [Candidatus Omnitrophica bacterium ADurb.Bin292]